jgi:hypothetical protein
MITSMDLTEIKVKGKHLIRNKFIIKLENRILRTQNSWREVATGKKNLEQTSCYSAKEKLNDRLAAKVRVVARSRAL